MDVAMGWMDVAMGWMDVAMRWMDGCRNGMDGGQSGKGHNGWMAVGAVEISEYSSCRKVNPSFFPGERRKEEVWR